MGREYLDASTRCVYTSGQNLGQTKNVLLAQNKCFLFDQYCFSKLLVKLTFEFAENLVSKVVGFLIWHAVVKTSSHLEHGDERYVLMPLLACPER